ncbi:MAG: sel1 repeat family protein [Alphaproteobacteria bacterium]|nr:sel1 repeat family protein [Alphaproteobacteria bacterium]
MRVLRVLVFVAALVLDGGLARAQSVVFAPDGIALQGYDPVAYFNENRAVHGNSRFSYFYLGSTWWFSSQRNRVAFSGSPEKFQPQFGGYDALGVSSGNTEDVDPSNFVLRDGRVYLFKTGDRKAAWNIEVNTYAARANANWPRLRASLAARQAERERADAAECEELYKINRRTRNFGPVIARCRPLAEQGDLRALEITAAVYDTRNQPLYNETDAVEFYKKAAEKGSKDAQYHTGRHYLYGRGVEKNPRQAVFWFERAADQGDMEAIRELAKLHRDGQHGVEKNLITAYMWFNLGALQATDAATERDRLRPLMKSDEILEAEARTIQRMTRVPRFTGPTVR